MRSEEQLLKAIRVQSMQSINSGVLMVVKIADFG